MWQPPPLADGQAGSHLHQPLYEIKLLLLWVTDSEVATVHIHLPCHLLRTTQLHLEVEKNYSLVSNQLFMSFWITLKCF